MESMTAAYGSALPSGFSPEQSKAPLLSFEGHLSAHLQGEAMASLGAREMAKEYLSTHSRRSLVTGAQELIAALEKLGCTVTEEIYRSKSEGYPVIVLTVTNQGGDYVLPNANLRLNPTLPEGLREDNTKHSTLNEGETQEVPGVRGNVGIELEHFHGKAEVRFALLDPVIAGAPYHLQPFFSKEAQSVAMLHAIRSVREGWEYSYVRDELLLPAVAQRVIKESALFGEQEVPAVVDAGSAPDGTVLRVKTTFLDSVEGNEQKKSLEITYAVLSEGMLLSVKEID